MIQAGSQYLRIVGPWYGFFGLGLVLYFASRAGRLPWPVLGNIARLVVAVAGGWLALHGGYAIAGVFMLQAAAMVVYGIANAWPLPVAWFGPGLAPGMAALLRRLPQG